MPLARLRANELQLSLILLNFCYKVYNRTVIGYTGPIIVLLLYCRKAKIGENKAFYY